MSLTAFKKKSVIQYGSRRSAKPPGGYWMSQGPFGKNNKDVDLFPYGPVGFSLNGGHRNVGYVGKTYQMSKMGTPFRGTFPCWTSGGQGGTYKLSLPVFNVNEVIVLGDQYKYIKPSVLSTKGMLQKRYKWIHNGQYPNYWVQPNYTGNQTDSASQGLYIHDISAANDCVNDVNNSEKYIGHIVNCGPTDCKTTPALYKYTTMSANAPYTKILKQPLTSSQQTLRIQRPCANPKGKIKPFPFAVNGGTGAGGIGVFRGVGGSSSCSNAQIARVEFLTPPAWYIQSNIDNVET
jgi:hypothetical protein